MRLNILFFGATADVVGRRKLELEADGETTAGAIFERVIDEFPALKKHRLLFSVNQEYSRDDQAVRDGDELAVFTAVSGG